MIPKILFICKQRNDKYGASFGLINSCNFVCNALTTKFGIEAKTVSVIDNNYIDKEVATFKPTHVFIEALWVVPEKFHVLLALHPTVKWHVRLHSRVPFLAHEGIAIEWLRRYYDEIQVNYPSQFFITSNNSDLQTTLATAFGISVAYHPNIYWPPAYAYVRPPYNAKTFIDIGCFGAVRPMKNHVYQALAAIAFGNVMGKKIRFHVNANRLEQKGEPILKNVEKCFENTRHELVKHEWLSHSMFIALVKSMDLGMQVSFSESFNIVAADFVANDIPVIGSEEINWLNYFFKASATDLHSMVDTLKTAYYGKPFNLHWLNKAGLNAYNKQALNVWADNLSI